MPERVTEVRETTAADPAGVTRTQTVATNSTDRKYVKAERLIYLIVSLIEILLAFRFVLALLGANTANAFAHLIYTLSYPFAAPFFGLFGYTTQYGVSQLELGTLVAMVVYAVIGWVINKLIRIGRI